MFKRKNCEFCEFLPRCSVSIGTQPLALSKVTVYIKKEKKKSPADSANPQKMCHVSKCDAFEWSWHVNDLLKTRMYYQELLLCKAYVLCSNAHILTRFARAKSRKMRKEQTVGRAGQ